VVWYTTSPVYCAHLTLGNFKILKIMNLASNCRYLLWFPLLCRRSGLPWCLILSVDAASNQACCKQHVCLSTRQRSISSRKDSIKQLQQETPVFIGPDLWPCTKQPRPESSGLQCLRCCATESAWMSHEQCWWAEAAPHWCLEQSAAEHYWHSHQQVEKETESMRACR